MKFHVYLARSADGVLYCGHTKNLNKELALYNSDSTFCTPVLLAHSEQHSSEEQAISRVNELKSMSTDELEHLAYGIFKLLNFPL